MTKAGRSGGLANQHTAHADLAEARRLLDAGLHLVKLMRYSKRPEGERWNWPQNRARQIDSNATGYGLPLAFNKMVSVDPDNWPLAVKGMAALGFDLEQIMDAGVRTKSTRPLSGGRSAFAEEPDLSWLRFSSRDLDVGTVLEFRASSENLQDCIPGVFYHDREGRGCSQHYVNGRRLDDLPGLPDDLMDWWQRCSTDLEFLREQQNTFMQAIGAKANLAVSAARGGKLAFEAPGYRSRFNAENRVEDLLRRHGYTWYPVAKRWRCPTASGAPGIRPIPGKDDLWQSDHASDPLSGTFDAWTAFVVLDHLGDLDAAKKAFQSNPSAEVITAREVSPPTLQIDITQKRDDQADEAAIRRAEQQRENDDIQRVLVNALDHTMPLEQMLKDLVFISDGSFITSLDFPRTALSLHDARNATRSSCLMVPVPGKNKPVKKLALDLWLEDPRRMTAEKRTFAPNADVFCNDPDGFRAINIWAPFERRPLEEATMQAYVQPFLEQIEYLIADETERKVFLDWLAHIEQKPGELPHYGWLHIATNTGTGRNWVASVLARVWRGNVAPNLDLPLLLDSGFNGQLSCRLLAMVDEVQEGGDGSYRSINKLKTLVNAESRTINPKYGRSVREFNCCRWLVFSNHDNALPITDEDRRWRVIKHTEPPRMAQVYVNLYGLLNKPLFIAAVAQFLGQRDITGFKPGERPPLSADKRETIEASKSTYRLLADELIETWPCDLITNNDAAGYLNTWAPRASLKPAQRHSLIDAGAYQIHKDSKPVQIKVSGMPAKVWILRNRQRWTNTAHSEIANALTAALGLVNQFKRSASGVDWTP